MIRPRLCQVFASAIMYSLFAVVGFRKFMEMYTTPLCQSAVASKSRTIRHNAVTIFILL